MEITTAIRIKCHHCGDECLDDSIHINELPFCCSGCKTVYELLQENDLCTYYKLDEHPGTSQKRKFVSGKFSYLDDIDLTKQLLSFSSANLAIVIFQIPAMHCNSCVWLLEKLYKIDKGILNSTVDFYRKTIQIKFDPRETSLRKVVELLASVGYEPDLTIDKIQSDNVKSLRKSRLLKLGVAGFCFGNIMLLSFPDYLATTYHDSYLQNIPFRLLSVMLALPVFFYSASEFYINAWSGLRRGFLNIDAPVFLAVLVTFVRSIYEVAIDRSGGYFDSMSGIVFFMLLGRVFQDITYKYISFDKNISSFIPIAISKKTNNGFEYVQVNSLQKGDIILVRNEEIIPVDAYLNQGRAEIDYSFVTGESVPQFFEPGEKIFSGGRQKAEAIELTVAEKVSESYLRSLWNNSNNGGRAEKAYNDSYIHKVSKWFTVLLFAIGFGAYGYWMMFDSQKALDALTTILIVACPCVLLLSHSFTYGFVSMILNRNGIYLRDVYIIDKTHDLNQVVFDKTGTLTNGISKNVIWKGEPLTNFELTLIRSLVMQSAHPKSKMILEFTGSGNKFQVKDFVASHGKGIQAHIEDSFIQIGSPSFVGMIQREAINQTFVQINGVIRGYFEFESVLKDDVARNVFEMQKIVDVSVLSGDNNADEELLKAKLGHKVPLVFNALPHQKVEYVKQLQTNNKKVVMVGDGVNDAAALMQADVGIAVAGQDAHFVPACDVYIEQQSFKFLAAFFKLIRYSKSVVIASFIFAIIYNTIGLYYAITAQLTPGIAAVLMPLSTLSIITITFTGIYFKSKKLGFN